MACGCHYLQRAQSRVTSDEITLAPLLGWKARDVLEELVDPGLEKLNYVSTACKAAREWFVDIQTR
jgi:hypothetical protein